MSRPIAPPAAPAGSHVTRTSMPDAGIQTARAGKLPRLCMSAGRVQAPPPVQAAALSVTSPSHTQSSYTPHVIVAEGALANGHGRVRSGVKPHMEDIENMRRNRSRHSVDEEYGSPHSTATPARLLEAELVCECAETRSAISHASPGTAC